ncbi:MAG: AarF/ABC1/UbiB kinase family protein [Planctomycetes bacterium]|nr:AarF/ABC1/UbiB kinase family protein [Planctomycetota bacterium]
MTSQVDRANSHAPSALPAVASSGSRGPSRPGVLDPRLVPTPLPVEERRSPAPSCQSGGRVLGLWQVARRALRIYLRLTSLGTQDGEAAREVGREVRKLLVELGGFWVKAGQMLSLRTDVFPLEFCLELLDLHDRAPAFPPEEVVRVVEEDLRRPFDSVFSEFDTSPVAAGSIGQSHLARLRSSGERVTVKVQRPEARAVLDRDLKFLRFLMRILSRNPRYRHFRWAEAIDALRLMFTEELDFRYEADGMRRLGADLEKHGQIHVPRVFGEYVSPRVLVLEHVRGVTMSEYLRAAHEDPDRAHTWQIENRVAPGRVARRLLHSFLRQVLEENFFHGDLHPANVVLLRDGWVALLESGSAGRLHHDVQKNLASVLRYVSERDYQGAVEHLLALAGPLPVVDPNALRFDWMRIFRTWDQRSYVREFPYDSKSLVHLWQELARVSQRHKLLFHWGLFRMDRSLLSLDVSLKELAPRLDWPRELARYFDGARKRFLSGARKPRALAGLAGNWGGFLRELPSQVRLLQSDMGSILHRRALNFQATSSKISYLLERVFTELRFLTLVAAAVLGLTFVHQKVWYFHWAKISQHRIDDVFFLCPNLTFPEWGVLILVVGWTFSVFHRLALRFARKESVLPGSSGGEF